MALAIKGLSLEKISQGFSSPFSFSSQADIPAHRITSYNVCYTKLLRREVLISRLIDRPIRPLFPEAFKNETRNNFV